MEAKQNLDMDSKERMKIHLETAMGWISKLDFPIGSISVYDFSVIIIANEHRTEFSNNILEVAKEKGVSFNISLYEDCLYYTCDDIDLTIIFPDE